MKKILCALGAVLLIAGCGKDEAPAAEEPVQAPAAEQTTSRPARQVVRRSDRSSPSESIRDSLPQHRIPDVEVLSDQDGMGLTFSVDGSSPEAFHESLELIAMDTSREQYAQLDSALRYLGTYDTAAWQGLANLYLTLDGMTGEEIIERAAAHRQVRSSRN